ncbi:MAG: site-2 protease family protein, partial [Thermodesulfatator sp.]
LANIAIALLFYPVSQFGGILRLIGYMGFKINAWLAAFNLLPLPPLDGWKVFSYSLKAWIALMAIAALMVLLPL